jgi:hypothetical protein
MSYYAKLRLAGRTSETEVPALDSLDEWQIAAASAALPILGLGWCLDVEEDYDGDRSIVISPVEAFEGDTSFVLYGSHEAVHLGKVSGDAWEYLGRFGSIERAMCTIASGHTTGA